MGLSYGVRELVHLSLQKACRVCRLTWLQGAWSSTSWSPGSRRRLCITLGVTWGYIRPQILTYVMFNKPCFYLQWSFMYSTDSSTSASEVVNQPFKKGSEKKHYLEWLVNELWWIHLKLHLNTIQKWLLQKRYRQLWLS